MHWWQSIRWRLVLGSVVLSLLATSLLALTAILAVFYYYGVDQKARMRTLAGDRVSSISINYSRNNHNISKAVIDELPTTPNAQKEQGEFLIIVQARVMVQGKQQMRVIYPLNNNKENQPDMLGLLSLLRLNDEALHKSDLLHLSEAIQKGWHGKPTEGEFARSGPFGFALPYYVLPVSVVNANGKTVIAGVLLVTPRSAAIPSFVSTVGTTVVLASVAVATLAALVAIGFSRTITRPLARLTGAARKLMAGDYHTQVQSEPPGELGELARTFNEMADQLRKDMEELRQQEAWRRELIMSVTHDLATPLTAIAGLGEALVDGVKQSREDYEATGRIIVRETLRLRRLVKDLHMMAKVEAGALQPQSKDVRLAPLVDEILAVLASEFERAHVEPHNNVSYNLPQARIDPDMITRVLANLCDNALRYTPSGGRVIIDAAVQNNRLVVSVTDTGEGIPREALSRIFERFYRADSARQSGTGGSGLGLAIVRAIVEAHNGTVWAENAPDAGARISFTLPLSSAPLGTDETTLPIPKKTMRSIQLRRLNKK
ncbi:MAG: HAMP domain-containing histidine kinase [Ktedonobacteraceae bacterium]|nr:HAMP domain-containing histidine kinase [Ktedonobacteraceae bacterium]MBO0795855.1 HAMP domain-containing histidine kinase [Ktedonobacteraceae bacterium]